jgi:hypothetical protein
MSSDEEPEVPTEAQKSLFETDPGRYERISDFGWSDMGRMLNLDAKRRQLQKDNAGPRAKIMELGRKKGIELKKNPFSRYNEKDTKELMDLVGHRNKGISFNPVFNSRVTAEAYIREQLANANKSGNQDLIDYWKKWEVKEADLDARPDTLNNVVVFSDFDNNIIKSIDGYQIVPRGKKEALRARYTAFPDRQKRAEAMNSQQKTILKAFFRKHPDPSTWQNYDIHQFAEDYGKNVSAFQQIKSVLKGFMDLAGLTLYKKSDDVGSISISPAKTAGKLSLTHHMTILQRLSAFALSFLYKIVYNEIIDDIPKDYDWIRDPMKLKTKGRSNELKSLLGDSYVDHLGILQGGFSDVPNFKANTFLNIYCLLIARGYLFLNRETDGGSSSSSSSS